VFHKVPIGTQEDSLSSAPVQKWAVERLEGITADFSGLVKRGVAAALRAAIIQGIVFDEVFAVLCPSRTIELHGPFLVFQEDGIAIASRALRGELGLSQSRHPYFLTKLAKKLAAIVCFAIGTGGAFPNFQSLARVFGFTPNRAKRLALKIQSRTAKTVFIWLSGLLGRRRRTARSETKSQNEKQTQAAHSNPVP
jgi:hypothetical protein